MKILIRQKKQFLQILELQKAPFILGSISCGHISMTIIYYITLQTKYKPFLQISLTFFKSQSRVRRNPCCDRALL